MTLENEEFSELYSLAKRVYFDEHRHADAAALFTRALQATGGGEEERFRAKKYLSNCYLELGRYTEALASFGELYVATKDRPRFHDIAVYSFSSQIEVWQYIHESEGQTEANAKKRLELVEEGLRWLQDIGKERWRYALLYHRAVALESLGKLEQALDTAEEVYRGASFGEGVGYTQAGYAWLVARYLRQLGNYKRAQEVLNEMEGKYMDPYSRMLVLTERVRLLRSTKPPKVTEALDMARQMIPRAEQIQEVRYTLFAYIEVAYTAIDVQSYMEARNALNQIYKIAIDNETVARPFLLREAQKSFRKVQDMLAKNENKVDQTLRQNLLEWLEEIEEALVASKAPSKAPELFVSNSVLGDEEKHI